MNCAAEDRANAEGPAGDSLVRESAGSPTAYAQARELVDERTDATSDAQFETRLLDIDRLLGSLPEVERRARMYELVMWLGLVDPA